MAFGEYETLVYGHPFIEEQLGNLTFEVSSNSFFQTNTIQGERLYDETAKAAGLLTTETAKH